MTPPEMAHSAASPTGTTVGGVTGGVLRTDLLHRHLAARVAAARETLEILEARDPSADERLVQRFGSLVAEAQQVLAAERAAAARDDIARLRAAEVEATLLVASARMDAQRMAAVAHALREAPVARPTPTTEPVAEPEAADPVVDVRDHEAEADVVVDLSDTSASEAAAP